MAVSFRNFALGCLVLLSIQQVALAVTCYSCTNCDSVSSSTATSSNNYCYKFVVSGSGSSYTNRDSISSCTAGSSTVSGVTGTVYCCSSDRCNGGVALPSSLGLAFSLVAAVIAAKWMMVNN